MIESPASSEELLDIGPVGFGFYQPPHEPLTHPVDGDTLRKLCVRTIERHALARQPVGLRGLCPRVMSYR